MSDVTASGSAVKGQLQKKCHELIISKVNTEDFIREVEKHPSIWNSSVEEYSNKLQKLNAWNDVVCTFIPNFVKRSSIEKKNIMLLIQKKWKSIRTCYTRELLRLKGVKSGSAARRKKQYIYFDQLRFLETAAKNTTRNVDETDVEDHEQNKPSTSFISNPTLNNYQSKSRKRINNDDELIEILKKRLALTENPKTSDTTDEDRMFLLSMLTEIHKVPAERKLKLRADMIALVAAAQAPVYQGLHQQPYPILQYPMPMQQPSVPQNPTTHLTQQKPTPQQNPKSELLIHEPQIILHQTQSQQSQDNNTLQSLLPVGTSINPNDESDETE